MKVSAQTDFLDTVARAIAITTEDERLLSLRHPVHPLPGDFVFNVGPWIRSNNQDVHKHYLFG